MASAWQGPRWATPRSSLAVLFAGNFTTILDLFIVNVALPQIQGDLHASNAELQLVLVAYSVSYGAMLLNGARLGDFYGRRRLFLVGMSLFALASLWCGLAATPCSLIAARIAQGVGAALLMPQVYASARLLFDEDSRRTAFSVMGAVQGIAGAASQVLGGILMTLDIGGLGWRLVFFVNLPIAAYALVAGQWFIIETKASVPERLDLIGAFLGTAALTAMLLPLMIGSEQQWPWWSIAVLLSSIPLSVAFIGYESRLARRGGTPVIDPALFKTAGFALGMVASMLFFSAISSFSLALTMLLQVGQGRSPLQAAMLFMPSTIAFFIGSLFSGRLARILPDHALSIGMIVFAGGLAIAVISGFTDYEVNPALHVSVILQGFGQGVVIPLLLGFVLDTVTDNQAGMASGAFSTMQTAGSAFGVTIVGMILFHIIDGSGAGSEATRVFEQGFAASTFYNLTAVIVSLFFFNRLARRR